MAIAASKLEQDDLSALQARIQLMLSEIDLAKDMSELVESSIAFGELGGAAADDQSKKLMILRERGDISSDELEQFIVAAHVEG